jgi:hypothetical protein
MAYDAGQGIGNAAKGAGLGAKVGGPVGALVGGGLGLLSGFFGGGESEEEKLARQLLLEYDEMGEIDWNKTLPKLERYKAVMVENPTLEPQQAALQSQAASIQDEPDPVLKKAKMQALGQLQQSSKDGLSLTDLAQIKRMETDTGKVIRGEREALLQRANASGQGMGGAALALAQQAAQDDQNRMSQANAEKAAQIQQARRDAMMKFGITSAEFEKQLLDTKMGKAKLVDARDQFNQQLAANVNSANTIALNNQKEAARRQRELEETSRVATTNQMAKNKAEIEEKKRTQAERDFEARAKLRQGIVTGGNKSAEQQANSNKSIGDAISSGVDIYKSLDGDDNDYAKKEKDIYGERNTRYGNITTGNTDE